MLKLNDLFQFKQVETALDEVLGAAAGLIVVAGPEGSLPDEATRPDACLLPSGKGMVFRTLAEELLSRNPKSIGVLVSDGSRELFSGRGILRKVHLVKVEKTTSYAEAIFSAAGKRPDLLLVDRMDELTAEPILEAARRGKAGGLKILTLYDTPLRSSGILKQLVDLGLRSEQFDGLGWLLTVQRLAVLCPECRREYLPEAQELRQLEFLQEQFDLGEADFPGPRSDSPLPVASPGKYTVSTGCPACRYSGRGEMWASSKSLGSRLEVGSRTTSRSGSLSKPACGASCSAASCRWATCFILMRTRFYERLPAWARHKPSWVRPRRLWRGHVLNCRRQPGSWSTATRRSSRSRTSGMP